MLDSPIERTSLQYFKDKIFGSVEGWLGDRIPDIIGLLADVHESRQVRGHMVEIGVHHGMFALLLASVRRSDEKIFLFDVFEEQELNIDNSGRGSRAILERNIDLFAPGEKEFFSIFQADSLSLRSRDLVDATSPVGVRFFSVDGGHTRIHVLNDMCLAQDVIVSGGIVILDDFFGYHWPSVTRGYYDFMSSQNRRLAPFLMFQNKLFLTTVSEQKLILEEFRVNLDRLVGDEIHSGRWRYVNMDDVSVLSFA